MDDILADRLISSFLLQKNKEYVSIAKGGFMGEQENDNTDKHISLHTHREVIWTWRGLFLRVSYSFCNGYIGEVMQQWLSVICQDLVWTNPSSFFSMK